MPFGLKKKSERCDRNVCRYVCRHIYVYIFDSTSINSCWEDIQETENIDCFSGEEVGGWDTRRGKRFFSTVHLWILTMEMSSLVKKQLVKIIMSKLNKIKAQIPKYQAL